MHSAYEWGNHAPPSRNDVSNSTGAHGESHICCPLYALPASPLTLRMQSEKLVSLHRRLAMTSAVLQEQAVSLAFVGCHTTHSYVVWEWGESAPSSSDETLMSLEERRKSHIR
jgi:hypothetical protein